MIILAFVAAAAYFMGSFSASICLSRLFLGGDVRKQGSGNAGATNMARVFGLGFGVITLLGDCLKAAASVFLGYRLLGEWGIFVGGYLCLIGHCFPVYYHFKGGKGVSVGAVLALAIDWRVFVAAVLCFGLVAGISRKVSLGSICAAIMIMVASVCFQVSTPRLLLAFFAAILVVLRHKDNMVRLYEGKESDFKPARSKRIDRKRKI